MTHVDTGLGAAFTRAGVDPREVALNIALARFRNHGGTYMEKRLLKNLWQAWRREAYEQVPQQEVIVGLPPVADERALEAMPAQ